MNKNLYILLILFLGLTAVSGISNSIISIQLGAEIYTLDSYIAWLLVVHITAVIGSILLLKYYYHQNYRWAFFTGIIAAVANFSLAAVIYVILTSGEFRSYYVPALLFSVCANVVYTVSLLFSGTRKRFWLKLAGIFGLVVGLILLSVIIGSLYSKDVRINSVLGKIGLWASVVGSLVNVLFIMNFLSEIKAANTQNANKPRQEYFQIIFGFTAIFAFIFTISCGTLLIGEKSTKLYWKNYNAEQAQQLVKLAGGASIFIDSKGDSLHYLLIKPQGYNPQRKYPLVISLPYGGYEAAAAELLSTGIDRSTYHAFIFVPYCPEGKGWGGIPGYPSLDSLVYETISALAEPGIDIKRRYVTGISRGGYGTWQFICTRPDMFAAAVPVCGGGDPKLASKIVKIPVWAFHGAKDRNVPVGGSRNMIAAIKKAGGNPKYTEFQDEAHNIWDHVNKTAGLWDWLFAQKQQ